MAHPCRPGLMATSTRLTGSVTGSGVPLFGPDWKYTSAGAGSAKAPCPMTMSPAVLRATPLGETSPSNRTCGGAAYAGVDPRPR